MTDVSVTETEGRAEEPAAGVDDELVAQLVARAQADGLRLTGEGGLLQQLTKRVLESALEGELTGHLGHEHGEKGEGGRENYRNGRRAKTVVTEVGPVEIEVPRDRAGTFEPTGQEAAAAARRDRRDGLVAVRQGPHAWGDLRAPRRGLRHRGVEADHLHDHRQRGRRHAGMAEPALDAVYPVVFIDCVHVKVRVLSTIL